MSLILGSKRSVRDKPPVGSTVDWGHPLAQNLEACWLFNEFGAGRFFDIARNLRHCINGDTTNITWQMTERGPCVKVAANAGTATVLLPTTLATGTTWSWDALIFPVTPDNYATLITNSNTSGLWFRGGVNMKLSYYQAGDNLSTTALTASTWNHYVLAVTTTGIAFYLNGFADGTKAITTSSHTLDRMFNDPSSDTFDGFVAFQRVWLNRTLTASEAMWLYQDPYCFIAPQAPRIRYFWLTPSAAPPATGGSGMLLSDRRNRRVLVAA